MEIEVYDEGPDYHGHGGRGGYFEGDLHMFVQTFRHLGSSPRAHREEALSAAAGVSRSAVAKPVLTGVLDSAATPHEEQLRITAEPNATIGLKPVHRITFALQKHAARIVEITGSSLHIHLGALLFVVIVLLNLLAQQRRSRRIALEKQPARASPQDGLLGAPSPLDGDAAARAEEADGPRKSRLAKSAQLSVPPPLPRLPQTGMSFVVPAGAPLAGGKGSLALRIPCTPVKWDIGVELAPAEDGEALGQRLRLIDAAQAEPLMVCTTAPPCNPCTGGSDEEAPSAEASSPHMQLQFFVTDSEEPVATGLLERSGSCVVRLDDGCSWHATFRSQQNDPQIVAVERQGRLIAQAVCRSPSCRNVVQVDVETSQPSQEATLLLTLVLAMLAFGNDGSCE